MLREDENERVALEKEAALLKVLRANGRLAVAFSGGVDSTYLLSAAIDALGIENVLALTADSPLIPRAELERAGELAARLGVTHELLPMDTFAEPAIVANPLDRCYHCKRVVFGRLRAHAAALGFPMLIHGANVDDRSDYRPGQRAADELGVAAPLDAAGLTKVEIRWLSHRCGLPTWDLPAQACLATRIPFDTPLSPAALQQIERAEEYLHQRLDTLALRVRHYGEMARLELPPEHWPALLAAHQDIVDFFAGLGFATVTLDLAGLRSGSMHTLTKREG